MPPRLQPVNPQVAVPPLETPTGAWLARTVRFSTTYAVENRLAIPEKRPPATRPPGRPGGRAELARLPAPPLERPGALPHQHDDRHHARRHDGQRGQRRRFPQRLRGE